MTMHPMQPQLVKAEHIDPAFLPPSYHLQQQQLQQQQQQQQLHVQRQQLLQQQQSLRQQTQVPPPHLNHARKPAPEPTAPKKAVVNGNDDNQSPESQPDFPSVKGIFGWTTLDNVNIPYILRHDKQFVSVRIVEMKLLSRYPNSYPDDLGKHAPLTSFFITTNEAKLLNEINLHHCAAEYGKKEFTTKDLIVLLTDFTRFYELVKKTFPDPKSARETQLEYSTAGWLQIKNTVTPFVKRVDGKYVPLSVIQYAAGLLTGDRVSGVAPTAKECELLNDACKTAGVEFVFTETTRLIRVSDILKAAQVEIIELPNANPLKHATYMELPTTSTVQQQEKPKVVSTAPQAAKKAQQQQQPYRFQPTAQMDMMRAQLAERMAQQEQNVRPPLGFPNPRMFNPMADMYRVPFSGINQAPFLPQVPPPLPFGHLPPNMMSPMMQYYLGMQNQAGLGMQNQAGPPNRVVTSQPLPQIPNGGGAMDHPSRSPGASSSNPSPRSRPPSISRPPSGSRPPSESPLSPTLSPNHLTGSLQQMQDMYARFPAGLPPGLVPVGPPGLPGRPPAVPTEPSRPTEHLRSPPTNATQLPGHLKDANQEIPGLFSPTGTNHVTPAPKPTHQAPKPTSTDIGAPPPLLLMSNPVPSKPKVVQSTPTAVADVGTGLPQSGNPVPTSLAAAKHTEPPAAPKLPEPPQPQPVSMVKQSAPETFTAKIKGAWLNSKSISCLHLENEERNGRYCLVEAVCKLYFNGCQVNEFLFALENVLNVPLLTCNDEEEKAFIQYYSLPVEVLKCNKMIKFDDLENFFPQLSYMFPDKNSQDLALSQESEETIMHDVNFGHENNNVSDKGGLANGGLTEADVEAAMPGVMADMVTGGPQKRRGDSLDDTLSPKQPRTQNGGGALDDSVIVLD